MNPFPCGLKRPRKPTLPLLDNKIIYLHCRLLHGVSYQEMDKKEGN